MKKIFICLLLIFVLVPVFATVFATVVFAAGLDLVYDSADLLNYAEWEKLLSKAETISNRRKCDVVLFSVGETTDGKSGSIYKRARSAYEQNNYGYGADKSCLMFYLNMTEREFSLETFGKVGRIFTQDKIDDMLNNHILPLLKKDKYYEAFSVYLNEADQYLAAYNGGIIRNRLLIMVIPSLLIALIVCLVLKSRMRTAVTARSADQYIPKGGFKLTLKEDRFLFRTETRRLVESSSSGNGSSSGGHGSSGFGSSGRSSPGRSGKF